MRGRADRRPIGAIAGVDGREGGPAGGRTGHQFELHPAVQVTSGGLVRVLGALARGVQRVGGVEWVRRRTRRLRVDAIAGVNGRLGGSAGGRLGHQFELHPKVQVAVGGIVRVLGGVTRPV
ncbi:hypothetical protein BU14_0314s0012 [Porphyra umbilicalis]|uniref:Uncharacterized protein n=1 Tax=Porphyra umbilicalis TaxID=2786 RepID=A0A1X6NZH1_PORUM|nr:hypothetical protein BU14_0314s0012 [Porphyra umbilicalis]|eukprot:OSX74009.1 hypothetical protein BU14_0314s0012 [Porphyra umbilicalis]